MVAVVTGSGLGLSTSSLSYLGAAGAGGNAPNGRTSERVFVNAATGNLVIQNQDEALTAGGLDLGLIRTYNSQGKLDDDNADNWKLGVYRRVYGLTGTVNTAGSKVIKVFGDGAEVTYSYDAALSKYVSTDGDGAHDTLSYSSGTGQWTWTDGTTRGTETYDSVGKLLNAKDADGNTVAYGYTGSLLTQVADASGQATYLDYAGNNLTQVRVVSSAQTQTLTRYTYDGQNRLSTVTVDLSPVDNVVSDNNKYVTTYTYDGTSTRVASLTQRYGASANVISSVGFTYELTNGAFRVKTYTDGEGRITTLTYSQASTIVNDDLTVSANAGAISTTEQQNVNTNYNLNAGLLTTPTSAWGTTALLDVLSTAAATPKTAFDSNGDGFAVWAQGSDLMVSRYTRSNNTWSTPVARDSLGNAVNAPALAIDGAGNAIVGWVQSDGTSASTYVVRYAASTSSWSTAVQIDNLNGASNGVTTTAGSVSVSINGTIAAATWVQTNTNNNLYAARFNGTSWSTPSLLETRTNSASVPSVAVDTSGNVNVVWQQSDGTAESIYRNRYSVSSGTWGTATTLDTVGTATATPQTAFDGSGNGFAVWAQGNDLMVSRYTSSSNTWATPAARDSLGNAVSSPALAIDNAGNAIVGWVQSDGTSASMYVSRYSVSSSTWSSAAQIDALNGASNGVTTTAGSVSVAINGGIAAAAWVQTNTNNNLYSARFDGSTWSSPTLLESRTEAATVPSVAVDSLGNVNVVWQQSDGTAQSIYRSRFVVATGSPYYTIPASSTWQTVANTLYGVNSVEAGNALQTAMGGGALPAAGTQVSGWPSVLTVTTVQNVTVPAYYTVPASATWASITLAVYGTSDANAVAALQAATGSPALSTGLHLPVPLTLTYTPVGGTPGQTLYLQTDVSDALGLVTTYVKDSQGRLTTILSPTLGGGRLESRYAYDAAGNVTSITEDPLGLNRVTTFQYDTSGNLTLSRDGAGNTVTRTYSANNQLLTETTYLVADPDGAGAGLPSTPLTTRFAYDSEDHLRFVISADGRVTENRYNAGGQRTSARIYLGAVYSVGALPPTTTLSESQLTTWIATPQDQTKIQLVDYAYDFRGNLTSATSYTATNSSGVGQAVGASVVRYTYDQRGQLLSRIDPRGEATAGDPNDYVTSYTYDGMGRVLTSTSWVASGSTISNSTQYDDANNRLVTTMANGLVTTTVYDKVGATISVVNSDTSSAVLGTTTYAYDAGGRLRMSTDPTGIKQYLIYDEAGRKSGQIDGDGTLTQFIYNKASQLVKTVVYSSQLASATLATLVDAQGKPTNVTIATLVASLASVPGRNAALDQISRNVYDTAGRLVYEIDAVGAVTQSFYDGASRVTDVVAYKNTVTIAPATDEVLPGAVTITTDSANDRRLRNFYDNDGHLTGTLDAAGYLVEYVYDNGGRLTQQIAYADLTSSTYWLTGTLAQLRPATDTETVVDPERDIVSWFFYDNRGNRVAVLDGEGYLTETSYNEANLASQVSRTNQVLTYTPGNTLAQLKATITGTPTVHSTSYLYDSLGRKTQETNYEGTITLYAYGALGNLLSSTVANATSDVRKTQAIYDALGRVTKELTAEGSAQIVGGMTQPQIDAIWAQYAVNHTYDLAGRRVSTTDQNGNKALFYYDTDGRLTHTVNSAGEVTESRYNALNQLTDVVRYTARIAPASLAGLTGGLVNGAFTTLVSGLANAANDAKTTYTYSLVGRALTATTAEGALKTYTYNAFGEALTVTTKLDATRNTVEQSTYDRRGLATQTRWDPTINTTVDRIYDAFGNLKSSTDQYSNVNRTEYDRLGRVITTYSALNSKHVTTYDAFSRVLTTVDAMSPANTTTYAYDDTARSMTVTTPEGIAVTTTHNRHGQTLTVVAGGNTTTYGYDANGQLSSVSDLLGSLEGRTYDKAGRQLTQTDARSTVTSFGYDAANRVLTRTVDSAGLNLITTYVYDGQGRVTQVTEPNGRVTATTYDRDSRVTQVAIDPTVLNLRTTYAYDNSGHVINVTEGFGGANPRRVQYVYDLLGRRTDQYEDATSMGGVLNLRTQYKYDANGNLTRKIDARNFSTWYVYDADQRLTHTIDALGGVTQTTYDAENRVTGTKRFANTISSPTLTALATTDRATSVTVTANSTLDRLEQTVYDRDGRAVYTINPAYGVIERTFDALGNVTRERLHVTVPAAAVYSSPSGVRSALDTADGGAANSIDVLKVDDRVQWFAYDLRGQRTFSISAIDGTNGVVTQFKYDNNGNVSETRQFATTRLLTAATDQTTLLSWVTTNSNAADRVTRYWYDVTDRVRFALDAEGYLKETRYNDSTRQETSIVYAGTKPTIAAGATLANVVSAAAAVANSGVDQSTVTVYDKAGRVSTVTDANSKTETYTYWETGQKKTYTNAKGATWDYEYDGNGRLTKEKAPLVSVTSVSGGDGTLAAVSPVSIRLETTMTYDALGNVLSRTEAANTGSARTTSYQYDQLGRQTVTTYPTVGAYNSAADSASNAGTAVIRKETSTAITTQVFYDTLGNAYRNIDVNGNSSYKTYDALGRVRFEIDARNYLTEYSYDAFGNQTTLTRYAASPSSVAPTSGSSTVTAVLTAGVDRTVNTTYDRLNRVTQVSQPAVFAFDPNTGSAGGTSFTTSPTTLYEYDVLGRVVRERTLLKTGSPNTYADTYFYYDRVGNRTAVVDAEGYLTTYAYDETGDLTRQVEYAKKITTWSTTGYSGVTATTRSTSPDDALGYDRETTFAYDKLNRKTGMTEVAVEYSTVSAGSATRTSGNRTTTFAYDEVGNQVSMTVNGGTSFSYFDSLGRLTATADAPRDRGDGTSLIPIKVMQRDAHGNLVQLTEYANGATGASLAGHNENANVDDRTTLFAYDLSGRMIHSMDGVGAHRYASYTKSGDVAKEWQYITNNDGATEALVTIYQYDAVGNRTALIQPQSLSGTSVIITEQVHYNAFGEVDQKGKNGSYQEYFDYDQAGRVWRSNSSDGVDKVYLYDLLGNATAQIRAAAITGGVSRDLKTYVGSASAALALPAADQRRTETRYDKLGRIVEQREVTFSGPSSQDSVSGAFSIGKPLDSRLFVYWPAPSAGTVQTFQWRTAGSTVWSTAAGVANLGGGLSGFDVTSFSGNFEFLVTYSRPGDTVAYAVHTGSFTVTSSTVWSIGATTNAAVGAPVNTGWLASGGGATSTWTRSTAAATSATLELRQGTAAWVSYAGTLSGSTWTFAVGSIPDGTWDVRVTEFANGLTVGMSAQTTVRFPTQTVSSIVNSTWSTTEMPMPTASFWDGSWYPVYIDEYTTYYEWEPGGGNIFWGSAGNSMSDWISVTGGTSVGSYLTYFNSETTAWLSNLDYGTYNFTIHRLDSNLAEVSHVSGYFNFVGSGTTITVTEGGGGSTLPGAIQWGVVQSNQAMQWTQAPVSGGTVSAWYVNTSVSQNVVPWTVGSLGGSNYYLSLASLSTGHYVWGIDYKNASGVTYLSAAGGSFDILFSGTGWTMTPKPQIGSVAGLADNGNRVLSWTTLADSGVPTTVEFKYRQQGASTWANTIVATSISGGYQVNLGALGLSGAYEYEITYKTSTNAIYRVANGTVTLTSAVITNGSNLTDTTSTTLAPLNYTPILLEAVDRWGQVLAYTDAAGNTTNYRYSQRGQVIEVKNPQVTVLSTSGATVTQSTARSVSSNHYDLNGGLVGTVDGNGNVNRLTNNVAGQAIQELHADGGTKRLVYNAFGNQAEVTDELGFRVRSGYDKAGRLVQVAQEVTSNAFGNADPYAYSYLMTNANVVTYKYGFDEAGRRKWETTGALMDDGVTEETTKYWYDLLDHVTRRRAPRNRGDVTYEYDAFGLGKVTKETQPQVAAALAADYQTWTYVDDAAHNGYFGRATSHLDMGGVTYTYGYGAETALLNSETNSGGKNVSYTYDAAGHVTNIHDTAVGRDTDYTYDVAGRVSREKVTIGGVVHQDTRTTYDAMGRVASLSDPRYRTSYAYDGAGNRARVTSHYFNQSGTDQTSDLWYSYDSMNRVKISQGTGSVGGTVALGTAPGPGASLTYNLRGDRTGAIQYGTGMSYFAGDDGYGGSYSEWSSAPGYVSLTYTYDGLGRLTVTTQLTSSYVYGATSTQNTAIDSRAYDAASRLTAQFWGGVEGIYMVSRQNAMVYDDDGRMTQQTSLKNGTKESVINYGDAVYSSTPAGSYSYYDPFTGQYESYSYSASTSWTAGYDAAGTLHGYAIKVYDMGTSNPDDVAYISTHALDYRKAESLQEISDSVTSTAGGPYGGLVTRSYNANNELVQIVDSQDQTRNRYLANDQNGQLITAVQGQYDGLSGRQTAAQALASALGAVGGANGYKMQNILVAGGQQVGTLLSSGSSVTANFDVNYTPISDHYPAAVPSEVVVQQGDTLRLIAARVLGDAGLWYLIAEENGLTDPNAVLPTGRSLTIPNSVVSLANTSSTYKPFSVQDAIGDTTPTQPMPPVPKAKAGCGVLGQVLMIVVAIVVTVYTAGLASGATAIANAGGSVFGAGASALGGGSIGAAAVGGAAGSIASQAVGIATGNLDGFDWKGVALGAIGAGVTAGLGAAAQGVASITTLADGSPNLFAALNGATGSALTQGIAVATGLQEQFSWRDVAISAVASPVAKNVGTQVGGSNAFAGRLAAGLSGTAVRLAMGGRVDTVSALADAFGNALGNSIVDKLASTPGAAAALGATTMARGMEDWLNGDSESARQWNNLGSLAGDLDNNPENIVSAGAGSSTASSTSLLSADDLRLPPIDLASLLQQDAEPMEVTVEARRWNGTDNRNLQHLTTPMLYGGGGMLDDHGDEIARRTLQMTDMGFDPLLVRNDAAILNEMFTPWSQITTGVAGLYNFGVKVGAGLQSIPVWAMSGFNVDETVGFQRDIRDAASIHLNSPFATAIAPQIERLNPYVRLGMEVVGDTAMMVPVLAGLRSLAADSVMLNRPLQFPITVGDNVPNAFGQAGASSFRLQGIIEPQSGGVNLALTYKPGWTAAQRAEADLKVKLLTEGDTVVSQVSRSGTSAASRYRSAGNQIPAGSDVDHAIDLQLGGSDTLSNMWPLNSSVNRSLGAQIQQQIRDLAPGTVINRVTIGER